MVARKPRHNADVRRSDDEPLFTRGDVARILGVTPATMANREREGTYPPATRDVNNYRIYTLNDVLNLQVITRGTIDTRRVCEVLYDKGYTDLKQMGLIIERALARRKAI